MRGAWRVADVRAAEEALMATLPEGALMMRAAAGLARRCLSLLGDRYGAAYGRRVMLLIGSGANGGDALYAGAALARRGVVVEALLLSEKVFTSGLEELTRAGGRVVAKATGADLVVDGIIGIGGRGGLRPEAAEAVRDATKGNPTVVAVDTPSGIDVDTGAVPGEAVHADVTVTFGCLKPGLVVGPGARLAGLVELVDIGLGPYLGTAPALRVPDGADVRGWWPRPRPDDDKYRRGVVGIAAGSDRYTGAAVLAVAGALAGPAGMVRYAGAAGREVRFHHPSAIVTDRAADTGRVQAWTAGSGLGTDSRAMAEVRTVLAAPVPVCLDADALTLLPTLGSLDGRGAPTVITPHDGEYRRLAGEPVGPDRVAASLRLAAQLQAVVLLKGDRTIVATPAGEVWVNPTGTAHLASGGTGDVLAGLLGSLLAGGVPAPEAAVAAAYAHGLAGRRAAAFGPVTAVDVAACLRPAVASIRR